MERGAHGHDAHRLVPQGVDRRQVEQVLERARYEPRYTGSPSARASAAAISSERALSSADADRGAGVGEADAVIGEVTSAASQPGPARAASSRPARLRRLRRLARDAPAMATSRSRQSIDRGCRHRAGLRRRRRRADGEPVYRRGLVYGRAQEPARPDAGRRPEEQAGGPSWPWAPRSITISASTDSSARCSRGSARWSSPPASTSNSSHFKDGQLADAGPGRPSATWWRRFWPWPAVPATSSVHRRSLPVAPRSGIRPYRTAPCR